MLIPYFEATDIAKIDYAAMKAFDAWRTEQNKKPFSQSGINNHNAALNRVFDEAELHGWLVKSLRPSVVDVAFSMLAAGTIAEAELLAALGVERDGYVVTEEIAMKTLAAKRDELISAETLLRILNG